MTRHKFTYTEVQTLLDQGFTSPLRNDNHKRDGISKSYYPSGAVKAEWNYKGGNREGISKSYYESGALKWEGNFKNGKLDGISKTYYPSGALKWEVHYKNGIVISQKNYKDSETTK